MSELPPRKLLICKTCPCFTENYKGGNLMACVNGGWATTSTRDVWDTIPMRDTCERLLETIVLEQEDD